MKNDKHDSSGRGLKGSGNESGAAMLIVLWIVTVLVMVTSTFALTALYRQDTSKSAVEMFQAEQMTSAGIEAFLGQLRDDALIGDDTDIPAGVMPTEIMNQNNQGKIRINEIKAADLNDYTCDVNPGFHMELVNTGSAPKNIEGWFGRLATSIQMGPTEEIDDTTYDHYDRIGDETGQDIYLCPLHGDGTCTSRGPNYQRFYAIGTPDNILSGGVPVEMRVCEGDLSRSECDSADRTDTGVVDWAITNNSCKGAPPANCGLTWQVFPDGTHGQKPSATRDLRDSPTNWVKAPCTMDPDINDGDTINRRNRSYYGANRGSAVTEFNGQGFWIKRGNNQYEGLRFTQHKGNGDDLVYDFGADISFNDLKDKGAFDANDGLLGGGPGGAPYCKKIRSKGSIPGDYECERGTPCQESCNFKERFYVDTMNSTGAAIFTHGLTRDALGELYGDEADTAYVDRNGFRHAVPVIPLGLLHRNLGRPTGEAFPMFRNKDDRKIKMDVPKDKYQPLDQSTITRWTEYEYTDRNAEPTANLDLVPLFDQLSTETTSGEHGWLVRNQTSRDHTQGLLRGDSSYAEPDPGGYRTPVSWYTGSSADYHFDKNTYADSRLYVSEVYDTNASQMENKYTNSTCNLKISFGRRDGGVSSSTNFVEVFNPGPETYTLGEIQQSKFHNTGCEGSAPAGVRWKKGGGCLLGGDHYYRFETPSERSPAESPLWSGSEILEPGDYFLVAQNTSMTNSSEIDYVDSELLNNNNDFGIRIFDDNGNLCDKFGADYTSESPDHDLGDIWYESQPNTYSDDIQPRGDDTVFYRKKSRRFPEALPRDTNNADNGDNENDFVNHGVDGNGWTEAKDVKWHRADRPWAKGFMNFHYIKPDRTRSFVEVYHFNGPELKSSISSDYIELYNAGDTIDPTGGKIRVSDSKDSKGHDLVAPPSYDLRLHWLDPYYDGGGAAGGADGTLKPGQVALIVEPDTDIDTTAIGWRDEGILPFLEGRDINKDGLGDTIRVYTAGPSDDEFLTGGIYNEEMEQFTFRGPNTYDVVDGSGSGWDQDCALANHSCFKIAIEGDNSGDNWSGFSRLNGTPGEIHTFDHHDEEWGWGGQLTIDGNNIRLDQPICVPSMTNCPDPPNDKQPGDLGYFRFLRIEDESGKINLLNPPTSFSDFDTESLRIGGEAGGPDDDLDDPDNDGRSFLGAYWSYEPVRNLLKMRGDGSKMWLSPEGMLRVEDIISHKYDYTYNALDEYEHVYTTMRADSENKRVNINMAPYEALHGIQVNYAGVEPTFMTETMVAQILSARQCSSFSSGDTIPAEDYSCDMSPHPFRTVDEVCTFLNDNAAVSESVNCEALHDNAKVWSGGIARGVVEGVVFDEGPYRGKSKWEVMVDRRGVNRTGRSMRILFQKKY